MLATEKLCGILTALGGNPASLADMMDITIIDAIVTQINTKVTGRTPTAAEVVTAIEAMDTTQIEKVKTALGINEEIVN